MKHFNSKHDMANSRLYMVWAAMKYRCHNPRHKDYYLYGARGITVCRRWRNSFNAFYADVGHRPSDKHSLDRIDGNRGYGPANCRWALPLEQNRNRRNTKKLTLNGVTMSMMEWSQRIRINYSTLRFRINECGMSDHQALTTPVRRKSA